MVNQINHKNKMIHIPNEYLKLSNLGFNEVLLMYQKGWIDINTFKSFLADFMYSTKNYKDEWVNMLITDNSDLNYILSEIVLENNETNLDKILIGIFTYLYDTISHLEKTLDIIEDIYCDLNHLPELESFVRYMPKDGKLGGNIVNLDGLRLRLKNYLNIKNIQLELGISFNEVDWVGM